MKPTVFSYIKGDKTPSLMKIILKADTGWAAEILGQRGLADLYQQYRPDLVLNFRYEQDHLSVVTGVAYPEFTMDKQLEFAWDEMIPQYFRQLGIA